MDKVTAINIFLAVAKTGNFSQVAEQLALSRPMVTRYIAQMEEWLGIRLFHRTTRHVTLTESGKQAVIFCEKITHLVQEMTDELTSNTGELRGSLRITSSVSFGSTHLTKAINHFLAQHPKLSIQLDLSDKKVNLIEEQIDLALRICKEPEEQKIARKLSACRSVLVASPIYLAEKGTPTHPQELDQHRCLSHSHFNRTEWTFVANGKSQSYAFHQRFSCNDAISLLNATLMHTGIAMLPRFLTNEYVSNGQLKEILSDWQLPELSLYAIYNSRQNQPIALRKLLDFLIEEFSGKNW